ncbi:RNA 2',3'-cyclic phosphodiesterase [Xylanivirga thermophila]|uniref:RNA 2',3'-cyclic phosphodiesterase n=1 Tax=Xylanivirga thermophila TaxID=2496273 RepID=UPI00101D8E48|nr:RNA 2',3'-cyclic phosphodiesterase [Xylanivirga thermophila]
MRIFIAIELDNALKEDIYKKVCLIKEKSLKGNFTKKDNLHITIRFLGEIDNHEVDRVKGAMEQAAEKIKPFDITLGQLGKFDRGNSCILWSGVDKGLGHMKSVFHMLDEELFLQKFKKEYRPFKPHITLGREVVLDCPLKTVSQEIGIDKMGMTVEKITLMESIRRQGQLIYIPIFRSHFIK